MPVVNFFKFVGPHLRFSFSFKYYELVYMTVNKGKIRQGSLLV